MKKQQLKEILIQLILDFKLPIGRVYYTIQKNNTLNIFESVDINIRDNFETNLGKLKKVSLKSGFKWFNCSDEGKLFFEENKKELSEGFSKYVLYQSQF